MLDLDQLRRAKWHLDGTTVRTLDQARAFIESVGFCLMYPLRPAVLAPTFIGAWVGSDQQLPMWQQAFEDTRAQQATELMVRLLRERDAYEANLFGENNAFLVAGSIFPISMLWQESAIQSKHRSTASVRNTRNWPVTPSRRSNAADPFPSKSYRKCSAGAYLSARSITRWAS